MTPAELAEIRERAERAGEYTVSALGSKCLDQDIPALLAEVERLREALRGALIDFNTDNPRDFALVLMLHVHNQRVAEVLK